MEWTGLVVVWAKLLGIVVLFAGWGGLSLWIGEQAGGPRRSAAGWLEAAVLGAAATTLFGALVVLVLPLAGAAGWLHAGLGVLGLGLLARASRPERGWWLGVGAPWFAVTVLVAFGTLYVPVSYDAGLYQMQVVRLLESGPLSLGAANIHPRFGFNSAMLPLAALLRGPVFGADGLFLAGPALLLAVLGAVMEAVRRRWMAARLDAAFHLAWLGLGAWLLVLNETAFTWLGLSPGNDLAAGVLVFYGVLTALAVMGERDGTAVAVAALLCPVVMALAVVMKVSAAPVVLALVWAGVWARGAGWARETWRAAWLGLGAGVVMVMVSMLHGVMSSGCFVFPLVSSCVGGLPWTVDPQMVEKHAAMIRDFARAGFASEGADLSGWNWVPLWRAHLLPDRPFVHTLVLALPWLAGAALALRFACRTGPGCEWARGQSAALAGAVAASGLGGLLILATGPDPRFGLGFLVTFLAAVAAFAAVPGADYEIPPGTRRRLGQVLLVVFGLLLLRSAWGVHAGTAGLDAMRWRRVPEPDTYRLRNAEGFTIAVPANGEQCWDTAPPCAPGYEIPPGLHKTSLLGRTAWLGRGGARLARVDAGNASVVYPHPFPDPEPAERRGHSFSVRWLLQRVSTFRVDHGEGERRARVRFTVATHGAERMVGLEQDGRPVGERVAVRQGFWEFGEVTVEAEVTLRPGFNWFSIATDGPAVEISPGRPVYLLLVGPVEVSYLDGDGR
ncbi:MAG: hypothetical protein KJZ79_22515 [Bryobacteraceae bacterium]|nr:hypothetical protein [Bryobacteraceae bacterium]